MFSIVFVCTGNRCRSPLAAEITRALTEGRDVDVSSVGTLDMPGERSPAELVTVARESGVDLSAHRSKSLAATDLSGADLVIGFQREHVAAAVVEGGAPIEKTFSLPELVRLLDEGRIEGGDPVAAVAAAHAQRRSGPPFVPGEEVADPIGRGAAAYRNSAEEIRSLTARMVKSLFG